MTFKTHIYFYIFYLLGLQRKENGTSGAIEEVIIDEGREHRRTKGSLLGIFTRVVYSETNRKGTE